MQKPRSTADLVSELEEVLVNLNNYMTPAQLERKDPNVKYLGLQEVMSMAYENMQIEAKAALKIFRALQKRLRE